MNESLDATLGVSNTVSQNEEVHLSIKEVVECKKPPQINFTRVFNLNPEEPFQGLIVIVKDLLSSNVISLSEMKFNFESKWCNNLIDKIKKKELTRGDLIREEGFMISINYRGTLTCGYYFVKGTNKQGAIRELHRHLKAVMKDYSKDNIHIIRAELIDSSLIIKHIIDTINEGVHDIENNNKVDATKGISADFTKKD